MNHRPAFALGATLTTALIASGCATAREEPDTAALVRAGRLTDACQRAFFAGAPAREAVDAEIRRRAGMRLRLRVLSGPDDPEAPPPALPTLRFGSLVAMTVDTSPTEGASTVYAGVGAPVLEVRDHEPSRATSWQFAREMRPPLAHLMVTGAELPGSGETPRVILDALAVMLSVGMVDPHLRDRPTPPPTPIESLPPAAQGLMSRVNATPRCDVATGTRCARLLPLLPDPGRPAPTHLVFEAHWFVGSPNDCAQSRIIALPLPPGPDIAARLHALFAQGPVDVATAPTVDR